MAFIKRRRIAVSFVLPYALTWGATPWNGFFAPGVLLAALIVGDADRRPERAQCAGPECQPGRDTEP